MAAKGIGLYEERTRVTCHLPVNDVRQGAAVEKVLEYLKEQRHEDIGVEGFTHSVYRPAAFLGFWWNATRGMWIRDNIVLVFIDYKLSLSDVRLTEKVAELKRIIRKWYRYFGSPQDEIWVVAQQIIRQD
jgi:hypothetical protein